MSARNYSSTTPIATLVLAISDTDSIITITNYGDVWPAAPFTMIIDYDTANEEVVEVTSKNGTHNFFTVTRGVDGTTARSHSVGTSVRHGVSARDFTEAKATETSLAALEPQVLTNALEVQDLANGIYKEVVTDASGTRTLTGADSGRLVLLANNVSNDVTVPSGVFAPGARTDFIATGSGPVTFTAGAGCTMLSKEGNASLSAQYSGATIVYTSSSTCILVGDLG